MKIPRASEQSAEDGYLDGQLLIAMPVMSDPRFARSVIYLCAHSEDGAMGLVINQRASHISFPDLLERLVIVPSESEDDLSDKVRAMSIHVGGPVETGRGFVLHSSDYFANDSTLIDKGLSNYWGYNTIGFFAPDSKYSSSGTPGGQVQEFKAMVRSLHAAAPRGVAVVGCEVADRLVAPVVA